MALEEGSGLWGWGRQSIWAGAVQASSQPGGAKWLHSAYFLDGSSEEAVGNRVCARAG